MGRTGARCKRRCGGGVFGFFGLWPGRGAVDIGGGMRDISGAAVQRQDGRPQKDTKKFTDYCVFWANIPKV